MKEPIRFYGVGQEIPKQRCLPAFRVSRARPAGGWKVYRRWRDGSTLCVSGRSLRWVLRRALWRKSRGHRHFIQV